MKSQFQNWLLICGLITAATIKTAVGQAQSCPTTPGNLAPIVAYITTLSNVTLAQGSTMDPNTFYYLYISSPSATSSGAHPQLLGIRLRADNMANWDGIQDVNGNPQIYGGGDTNGNYLFSKSGMIQGVGYDCSQNGSQYTSSPYTVRFVIKTATEDSGYYTGTIHLKDGLYKCISNNAALSQYEDRIKPIFAP